MYNDWVCARRHFQRSAHSHKSDAIEKLCTWGVRTNKQPSGMSFMFFFAVCLPKSHGDASIRYCKKRMVSFTSHLLHVLENQILGWWFWWWTDDFTISSCNLDGFGTMFNTFSATRIEMLLHRQWLVKHLNTRRNIGLWVFLYWKDYCFLYSHWWARVNKRPVNIVSFEEVEVTTWFYMLKDGFAFEVGWQDCFLVCYTYLLDDYTP